MSSRNTRAVREDDEDKSSGLGLAAAAAVVGVGLAIGGALYYFFKPEEQAPHAAHGSTHRPHFRERAWSPEHCSICLELMLSEQTERPGSELWMLPCGHKFHMQCVRPWTQEHNTCPNCRKAI